MYAIIASTKFLKDLKLLKRRSEKDFLILQNLIEALASKGHKGLDKKHLPHKLSGKYKGYWECHVKPDLLLIWEEKDYMGRKGNPQINRIS